jgi:VWFA-related protein
VRHRTGLSMCATRLGLVVAAAVSLSAQQPASDPPPTVQTDQREQPPTFRTEANYVRVDVYPTRDGRPIQDLRAEDFELLENGVRQDISAFEHVLITPAGPQALRRDPGSVREAEQQVGSGRARVFVVFLDVPHVAVEGGAHIREPLIRLMDRVMGEDDLIAFMTPDMSPTQVTFGRKTEVAAAMLREGWTWGHRHSIRDMDEVERNYQLCFPSRPGEGRMSPEAQMMIARRRERMVLDALHGLANYLGGLREERKAILAITEGWVLYRPDSRVSMVRQDPLTGKYERVPDKPPIIVDEHGTLRIDGPDRTRPGAPSQNACDRDRMQLAMIDNDQYFRDLLEVANRNNASFYPIDPRGLAVFDYPIGPDSPPGIVVDQASLRQRLDVLRTLADNTDGMAVLNSNDLDAGLRRIADDLTSYYLLGYYSSNAKLDGTYRRITVRVRQPGVQVRARRGYRAATEEEVRAARAADAAPVPDSVRTASSALAALARVRPDQRFSIHAVPMRAPGADAVTSVWVIGEIVGPLQELAGGGTVSIELSGSASLTESVTIDPGQRTFLVKLPAAAGEAVDVRARLTPARGSDPPLSETARVELDDGSLRPLLYRRGPSTGNRVLPAGDFRFSRTERLRLELPLTAGATPGTGRLLDRNAQPLQVPVQIAERTDDEGQRWLTADVTLAPLAPGDYLVEVTYEAGTSGHQVLTALRVTR